jgi:hypothetical protein
MVHQYASRNCCFGGHVSSSYEIDATQELVAIGIANIAGGIFSSLPSQAPLARSAINSASGAKTQVSLLVGWAVQRMLSRDLGLRLLMFWK